MVMGTYAVSEIGESAMPSIVVACPIVACSFCVLPVETNAKFCSKPVVLILLQSVSTYLGFRMVRNNGHDTRSTLVGMVAVHNLRTHFALPITIVFAPTQIVLQRFKVHADSRNIGKVHAPYPILLSIVLLKGG